MLTYFTYPYTALPPENANVRNIDVFGMCIVKDKVYSIYMYQHILAVWFANINSQAESNTKTFSLLVSNKVNTD